MQSVVLRAYPASLVLFDVIKKLSTSPPPQPPLSSPFTSTTPTPSSSPAGATPTSRAAAGAAASANDVMMSMLYPAGSRADDSPLYVTVVNDTCSFTWTGDEHINQDIFECRTCGLLDTLCCCTECAHICHKGHDCKYVPCDVTCHDVQCVSASKTLRKFVNVCG